MKKINSYGKIGVFMGGVSSEREISLKSGKAVCQSLESLGADVCPVDINTEDIKANIDMISSKDIKCAFIALHGRFGEDGQIQAILDILGIPYTGSGVLASKLAMDKVSSKQVFQINGLSTPNYVVLDKASFSPNWYLYSKLKLPLVVKPVNCGSSIGLSIADDITGLTKAVDLAFSFDEKVMVEEFIEGREFTVAILDNRALPVIEIIPKRRFFDYEAKYTPGLTEYVVPAQIDSQTGSVIGDTAVSVHKALGCFGYSRVDIILGKGNVPYVLELNSIPGLTPTSLLPKAAKTVGIDFSNLCLKLIDTAYEKAKNRSW